MYPRQMKPASYKCSPLSVAVVLTVLLSGCAVLYDPPDADTGLQPGATKVQVSSALGAPARIVAEGDREAWLYCRKGAVLDRFVVAEFKGSRLENVKQQTEFNFGACEQLFEGVTLTSSGG